MRRGFQEIHEGAVEREALEGSGAGHNDPESGASGEELPQEYESEEGMRSFHS
jgi:hypothetical protein